MSKIKICGLRHTEDVNAVNRALPDFVGFVFAESRRKVDEKTAAALKERLDERIESVGVFVNQEVGYISDLYRKGIISHVQLHGDEDSGYIKRLHESCGCRIIKAASITNALPALPQGADFVLFDTASALRGGSGKTFEWSILNDYKGPPFILAGGLDASNAGKAVELLHPFCVDVSSGVETDGFKDAGKIFEFVRMVRRIQ